MTAFVSFHGRMRDQRPPADDADEESPSKRPNLAFLPIGITFMMLGVVFMATLDSLALGLVFLPVGVAFIAISLQEAGEGEGPDGDGVEDTAD